MNEEQKYQAIKELVDHGGNKQRVALKLGVSVRTVNRCIAACKSKGKAALFMGTDPPSC